MVIGVFVVVTDIATPSTVGQPHTHRFILTWGQRVGLATLLAIGTALPWASTE